jgi:hypothetical protein
MSGNNPFTYAHAYTFLLLLPRPILRPKPIPELTPTDLRRKCSCVNGL